MRDKLGSMEDVTRLTLDPVSKKQIAICITVVAVPCDIWSLNVCFVVIGMYLSCKGESVGIVNQTAQLRDYFVWSSSAPILGKSKVPCELALTGNGIRPTSEAFLVCSTTVLASVVCRTFFDELGNSGYSSGDSFALVVVDMHRTTVLTN